MIAFFMASALAVAPGEPGWDPVLHEDPYTFCNTPGSRAAESREWCDILEDAPPDRCPGLRATCEGAPPRADTEDLINAIRGCGEDQGRGRSLSEPEAPVPQREPMSCGEAPPIASSAGAIFRWVVAILVAVGVVLVARLLWQWIGSYTPKPKREERVEPVRVDVIASPDEVPDIPSDDLLSAARRALSDGRTGEAVLLARGAALRRLGEGGKVVLHRARTDREYVRAVRKDPEIEQPLRDVVRAVEQWRWGGRVVSSDVAKGAIDAVERIVRALGAALVLWVLSTGEARASRYGPYGDAALHTLFEEAGYDVSWRLRSLTSLAEDDVDVVILDLEGVEPAAEDHEALRVWVEAGGVLIIGGDATATFPEIGGYERYRYSGAGDTDAADTDAVEVEREIRTGSAVRRTGMAPSDLPVPVWPGGPQMSFTPGAAQVWIEADFPEAPARPVVVAMPYGQGAVIGIADALLLRNAALVAPANEGFLVAAPYAAHDAGLADVPVPAVIQLATRAGSDTDTPWQSLANAKLLPFVLQLFLLGGLIVLWRGWPFAPLQDPPAEGRIAFADHVRALGTQWMRLRASRRALSAHGRLWLARIGAQGLEAAARRAGRDAESANTFVRDLEKVAAQPEGPDDPSDLDKMEELWKITQRP